MQNASGSLSSVFHVPHLNMICRDPTHWWIGVRRSRGLFSFRWLQISTISHAPCSLLSKNGKKNRTLFLTETAKHGILSVAGNGAVDGAGPEPRGSVNGIATAWEGERMSFPPSAFRLPPSAFLWHRFPTGGSSLPRPERR